MADSIVVDVDAVLRERIDRIARANGWGERETLSRLLEQGLFACESELDASLSDSDAQALKEAIEAMEGIDDDPGFSRIGRD